MQIFIIFLSLIVFLIIYSILRGDQQRQSVEDTANPNIRTTVGFNDDDTKPYAPETNPDEAWVPAGQAVTIAGYEISGGLIYVGRALRSVDSQYTLEPALINPSLRVNSANPDFSGTSTSYWPSYDRITPEARAAYLAWLAGGRREPRINIGYVFLFFYGLERRLLIDSETCEQARWDARQIIRVVERLLEIYGENGSFYAHASSFLDVARCKYDIQSIGFSHNGQSRFGEYPLSLKLALSLFSLKGRPIPAQYALSWAEYHPETFLRTPAKRCHKEFETLFAIRYKEKFGNGFIVKPNKTRLKIKYRPATNSFYHEQLVTLNKFPDITRLAKPVNIFREIIEKCTDELDAYSRYIGRNPEERSSLKALAHIPIELLHKLKYEKIERLSDWLEGLLINRDTCLIDAPGFLRYVEYGDQEKLTRSDCVGIAHLMAKLGFGIEPDVRFDAGKIDPTGKVVVFRLEETAQNSPGDSYIAARTVIHLAASVSGADGSVSMEEKKQLEKHLGAILELSTQERKRLSAHLQYLLSSPVGLSGIKKRLKDLSMGERTSVSRFLITVANADGVIDPAEINTLKKIYKLLDLDPESIYSDIHGIQAAGSEEPVTIQKRPVSQNAGYALPPKRKENTRQNTGIVLDMSIVEQKIKQTERVQTILQDIFSEPFDDEVPPDISPSSKSADFLIEGLDQFHSRLLLYLLLKPRWSRPEFEKLCSKAGLMPDGAIETINDYAFELFEDMLIEENENIEINRDLAKEIMG